MKKNHAMQSLEMIMRQLNTQLSLFNSEEDTSNMIQTISNEKDNVYLEFQAKIIDTKQKGHKRLIVQAFYNWIIRLIDKAYHMSSELPKEQGHVLIVLKYLSITLEELQQFIEVNYPQFLSPEERVPRPELMNIKAALLLSMEKLPDILRQGNNNEKIIGVVMDAFDEFITRIDAGEVITLKEAAYHLEMSKSMLQPAEMVRLIPDCPTLHELLFYWNFNSRESITYFTSGLDALAKEEPGDQEKLEFLRFQFKRLLHLPVMPKIIYSKKYPSMKVYFAKWIKNEIDYLQQKISGVTPLIDHREHGKPVAPVKVLLNLSADQIGIILRSADEARILVAKSLSLVFKTVVPHLSTPRKDDPSWENMRSRTYNPERREIALAVDALEKMITIIKTY